MSPSRAHLKEYFAHHTVSLSLPPRNSTCKTSLPKPTRSKTVIICPPAPGPASPSSSLLCALSHGVAPPLSSINPLPQAIPTSCLSQTSFTCVYFYSSPGHYLIQAATVYHLDLLNTPIISPPCPLLAPCSSNPTYYKNNLLKFHIGLFPSPLPV